MKNKYLYDPTLKSFIVDLAYTKALIRTTNFEIHHTHLFESHRLELLHARRDYYQNLLASLLEQARNYEVNLAATQEVA